MSEAAPLFVLTLSCRDRVGIVAAVAPWLAEIDGFIVESQQHADLEAGRFFLRIEFQPAGERFPKIGTDGLRAGFAGIASRFAMAWSIRSISQRARVMIAVSKASHCLNDLLHRWQAGALPVEIAGVVSNHDTLRGLTEWHGVAFHHLPVNQPNRAEQESRIEGLIDETGSDYLVLARYMQVLTPAFADRLAGRCINIHHSFLPSFKGARPYARAHDRGVKLIGATAHFVTGDLDEGPIIEQDVERVDHRATEADLVRIGRDIEARVLARAVRWTAEDRVFLNGQRTVVFR